MIIIGHKLIPFIPFSKIQSVDDILQSPKSTILLFEYNEELIWHCQQNSLPFALHVDCVNQALIANGIKAKYIICNENLVSKVQELAEHYLFDSHVGVHVESEEDMYIWAEKRIDAVILPSGVLQWS